MNLVHGLASTLVMKRGHLRHWQYPCRMFGRMSHQNTERRLILVVDIRNPCLLVCIVRQAAQTHTRIRRSCTAPSMLQTVPAAPSSHSLPQCRHQFLGASVGPKTKSWGGSCASRSHSASRSGHGGHCGWAHSSRMRCCGVSRSLAPQRGALGSTDHPKYGQQPVQFLSGVPTLLLFQQ